jgi:hypothetical protein
LQEPTLINHEELLDKASEATELFYKEYPFYACTESTIQEKLGKKEKSEYKEKSVFDYLIIAKIDEMGFKIEESRLAKKIPKPDSNKPSLLKTNGFPNLSLIFHPLYRKDFEYWLEKELPLENKTVVHFRHLKGANSTSALTFQGRIYPLALQGIAEIDNQSGFIRKMAADLVAPMREINVESIHIEVEYDKAVIRPNSVRLWLPSKTIVNLQTASQRWRNTHVFSDYKRFSVYSLEVAQSDKRDR